MHRSYDLGMTQKRGDKGRARMSASRGETRMVHEVPEASHRLPASKESNVWCLSSLKKSCPAQCNQRCHEKVGSCRRTFLSTKIVSSLLNTLPRWKPSSLPSAGQRGGETRVWSPLRDQTRQKIHSIFVVAAAPQLLDAWRISNRIYIMSYGISYKAHIDVFLPTPWTS